MDASMSAMVVENGFIGLALMVRLLPLRVHRNNTNISSSSPPTIATSSSRLAVTLTAVSTTELGLGVGLGSSVLAATVITLLLGDGVCTDDIAADDVGKGVLMSEFVLFENGTGMGFSVLVVTVTVALFVGVLGDGVCTDDITAVNVGKEWISNRNQTELHR